MLRKSAEKPGVLIVFRISTATLDSLLAELFGTAALGPVFGTAMRSV